VRNLLGIAFGLLLANNAATFAQQYVISTIAGRGAPLFQPSALSAAIVPTGVAADIAGNVYFSSKNAVYRLDSSGALTRLAGGYAAGCGGDGGPAINALLNQPTGVAVDAAGAVYIADSGNTRLRKVSPDGVITSLAGNDNPACGPGGVPTVYVQLDRPVGVAVDAAGVVYIGDGSYGNSSVRKVSGGVVTTLISNVTGVITGVAADAAGSVYIASWGITKVAPNGVVSTVLVGNFQPSSVAVDAAGNVYFGDNTFGNGAVKKVTPRGVVSTLVAGMNYPHGVAIDAAGNLYIADSDGFRIRKLSPAGLLSTVAGNGTATYSGDGGPATDAQFQASGVALDAAGALYVADQSNGRVRRITPDGMITTVAGRGGTASSAPYGDAGQATDAVVRPMDVAVDSLGNLYIAEGPYIRKVGLDGIISTFKYLLATNLAFGPDGGLYVSGTTVSEILPSGAVVPVAGNGYVTPPCMYVFHGTPPPCQILPPQPPPSGDGGPATQATIFPAGIALDSASNVYVADRQGNGSIREVVNSTGVITTFAAGPLKTPMAVAFDGAGNLYIADYSNYRVQVVSTNGAVATIAGNGSQGHSGDGGLAVNAQLYAPRGLAVDADGNVYVSDGDSIRLLKPVTADTSTTLAPKHLFAPTEVQSR
jgi:sugar lactone lactonase YvrE